MGDILLDAVLKPYSQIMLIAIIVEMGVLYLVLSRCLRSDLKAVFSVTVIASICAQALAIACDSFSDSGSARGDLSGVASFLVILLPALSFLLVKVYLHTRFTRLTKLSVVVAFAIFGVAFTILALPAPSGVDANVYSIARVLLIGIYVCIVIGETLSEIILEKPPEAMLLLMYAIPMLTLWFIYVIGFSDRGVLAFMHVPGSDYAPTSVLAPLFMSSFLYIPFAVAVIRTNAVRVTLPSGKYGQSQGEHEQPQSGPGETKSPVLEPGLYYVQERRPRYSYAVFRNLSGSGTKGFLLTKGKPEQVADRYRLEKHIIVRLASGESKPGIIGSKELNRVYATVGMFAETYPGAPVMLDGLDYLAANNDFEDVLWLLLALSRKMKETGSPLLIPLCNLTGEEKRWVRGSRGKFFEAPELDEELPALAKNALGPAAGSILDKAMKETGVALQDVDFFVLPTLAGKLEETVSLLGLAEDGSEKAAKWLEAAKALSKSIMELAKMPWEEVRGNA